MRIITEDEQRNTTVAELPELAAHLTDVLEYLRWPADTPIDKVAAHLRTEFWMKPDPNRNFDWCAYFDGEEERGNYGYGPTKRDALLDMLENI